MPASMAGTEGHMRVAVVRFGTEGIAACDLPEHCFIDEPFRRTSDMTSTWGVLEHFLTSIN